jgi:hypothetical protein
VKSSILRTCVGDSRTIDSFVVTIGPPRLYNLPARAARRPRHHHEEAGDMTDGHEAAFTMELTRVFPLKHGIVEHGGGAHEIDAELGHVLLAACFFPLEHSVSRTRRPSRGYRVAL